MTILHDPDIFAPAHLSAARPGTVRRRRVVLGLAAALFITGVTAIGTTSPAAWSAFALAVSACGVYGFLVHRSRRVKLERGFMHMRAPGSMATDDFLGALARYAVQGECSVELPAPTVVASAWRGAFAVARFVVSYAAGWALAPIVFLLTIAVGRTPKDTTGQRWLANLEATQAKLREQSLRTLVISAAATASVTGVGAATVVGGAGVGVAAAAPGLPDQALPAAPSVAAAHAATATSTYTVASGDTLSSIAASFGTTYESLAAMNHLRDPNLIYPGQHLVVPQRARVAASRHATPTTYTVAAGDTLSGIASRFGTTFQSLAQINGISNPNMIQVGEVLRLSGSAAPTTRARTAPARSITPRRTTAPARTTSPSRPASPSRPSTPVHASSRAGTAVNTALAQVGKPYQWASAGPSSFDCSGLVMYAWESAGVRLAHYTVSQYEETTRIPESQLQPGDLVFYDTGDGAQPGHVTIYIGEGRIVTADSPGTVIRIESIDWDGVPMGFGRVG
jgi:cell wall-associated NlpC family hydrolase